MYLSLVFYMNSHIESGQYTHNECTMHEPNILCMRQCLQESIRLAGVIQSNDRAPGDYTGAIEDLKYYWDEYCEIATIDEQWHTRRLEECLSANNLAPIADLARMYLSGL